METGYIVKESKHTSLLEDGFMPVETALEVPVQEQHKFVPTDSSGTIYPENQPSMKCPSS